MGRIKRFLAWFDLFRKIVVNLIFLLILTAIAFIWWFGTPKLPAKGILYIDLASGLEDAPEPFPLSMDGTSPPLSLVEVLDALYLASQDPHVAFAILDLAHMPPTPLSRLEEVRQAILEFRKKKPVYAFAEQYSQSAYFLATAADKVVMSPLGWVSITGFSAHRWYMKDFLQRLGVRAFVFRAGKYKSAGEEFTRTSMSNEAKKNIQDWSSAIWKRLRDEIASARKVDPSMLQTLADKPGSMLQEYGGDPARLAHTIGLVDRLSDRWKETSHWKAMLGMDQEEELPRIDVRTYLRAKTDERHIPKKSHNKVAIVFASGAMLHGLPDWRSMDLDAVIDSLNHAKKEKEIKAVVLRLDSPGGEVFAAERLRQQIEAIREAGKPVIVSMGSVAASGAYWAASAADAIVASPMTLTGSIGVVLLLPKFYDGLEKLGIHNDGVGTASSAGALHPDLPLPSQAEKALRLGVRHIYHAFLEVVSKGRKKSLASIKEAAEGRVWVASDAKRLGLIDAIGGLRDAVQLAARLAGTAEDYESIVLAPKPWRWLLAGETGLSLSSALGRPLLIASLRGV